jgi:hypothetical protein
MSQGIQHLRSAGLLPPGADLTDGQLLERLVSRREPAALEALVRRHGPMRWGVCRRIPWTRLPRIGVIQLYDPDTATGSYSSQLTSWQHACSKGWK